jgi:hypothetical protein
MKSFLRLSVLVSVLALCAPAAGHATHENDLQPALNGNPQSNVTDGRSVPVHGDASVLVTGLLYRQSGWRGDAQSVSASQVTVLGSIRVHHVSRSLLLGRGRVTRAGARDRIRFTGSAETLLYIQPVARAFAQHWRAPAPSMQVTGAGTGFGLFCSGSDVRHPDVVDSVRPITGVLVVHRSNPGHRPVWFARPGHTANDWM